MSWAGHSAMRCDEGCICPPGPLDLASSTVRDLFDIVCITSILYGLSSDTDGSVASRQVGSNGTIEYVEGQRLASRYYCSSLFIIRLTRYPSSYPLQAPSPHLLRRYIRVYQHVAEPIGKMVSRARQKQRTLQDRWSGATYFSSLSFPRTSSTNRGMRTTLKSS